jgi:hypothetical protein
MMAAALALVAGLTVVTSSRWQVVPFVNGVRGPDPGSVQYAAQTVGESETAPDPYVNGVLAPAPSEQGYSQQSVGSSDATPAPYVDGVLGPVADEVQAIPTEVPATAATVTPETAPTPATTSSQVITPSQFSASAETYPRAASSSPQVFAPASFSSAPILYPRSGSSSSQVIAPSSFDSSPAIYPRPATASSPQTLVPSSFAVTPVANAGPASTSSSVQGTAVAVPDGIQDTDGDGVPDGSDNCPLVSNPGQENTDSGPPPSGTGAIGNGTGISGDDTTVPNGDSLGDACDPDNDNDGLPNASDPDPGGDITYDDNNNGDPCVPMGTDSADDGPSWDSDCNGVRDGVEGSCPLAVNPDGDDDGDGLLNTWEVCKWGTNPAVQDSDGDTLGDCTEAVDTNGNGIILGDFGSDALNSARAALLPAGVGAGQFGKDGDFDLNGNNIVAGDFGADTLTTARFALGVWTCQ